MMRAFKLSTGPDNASHVLEGTIDEKDRTDVVAIHFKETPAHSSYDWHPAPEKQFVITLSGTLEFVPPDSEKFVVRPGDVLLAEDNAGEGHGWRLIDDQPWRRAYIDGTRRRKPTRRWIRSKSISITADRWSSMPWSRSTTRSIRRWLSGGPAVKACAAPAR